MAFLIMAAAVGGFWSLGGWLTHQAGGILRRGLRSAAMPPSVRPR
jgi:hypothetical protein